MTQLTSPFVDSKYGWNYGESGWNTGMDENILKFSFMFDRNIDDIVSSLPSVTNGTAYFLTTDMRIYFGVSGAWYSTPTPRWFIVTLRSTGITYQFNGTDLIAVPNNSDLASQLSSVQVTISTLGTSAFLPKEYFASQADMDIVSSQANSYTDTLRSDLSDPNGSAEIGYGTRTVADVLQYVEIPPFVMNNSSLSVRDANKLALIDYLNSGKKVEIPAGELWISPGVELPSGCDVEGAGRDITKIFGDGDLFTISTAPGLQIRVANMSVANDITRGDLFSNTSSTDSQGQLFENVHFGKSTCHFRSTAPNLVHPRFIMCRFVDSTTYSRIFNGLWVYNEVDCYTWYCGGGVACSNGQSNTCSVVGGVYEYNRVSAFDLASPSGYTLGWTFTGVHFEGNGTADAGVPDVLLRTTTEQRIRSIVFIGCGFYEPRVSQPARVLVDAGGGGNIQGVKFIGGSVVGSVPLTNNNSDVTIDGTYIQTAAVGNIVTIAVAFPGNLNNSLGVLSIPAAEAGSSAVIASITLPVGTAFARISVRGNIQDGVAASSSAYLEATYNSAGNRITTLHDINNTVGANQGYIVAWNAGVIEVRNKAAMTSTQSANIIIELFK